ncbi:BTB/POZ domain-containing protein At4g01160-like [Ananas comosus]|uniref:BTB/POZ domain-containing protein At4g01160-like n=1 Tax=Ananas comosus TaxID=4615 RepID=A0A6P5GFQ9_ANACO|nr:BTB/POZ domain-containing protein At4g01160-like [Ananas comosus]
MKVELMSSESEERGLEESMTSESEESGHEESMTSENEDAELEEEGEHDDDDDIFYDSDQSFNAVDVDLAEKLRTAFPFHSSAEFYFRIILIQDDAPENINQEGEDDQNLIIYDSTFSQAPTGATEVWYNVRTENLNETKLEGIIRKARRNIITLLMKRSEELSFRKIMKILHRLADLTTINVQDLPRLVAAATKWEVNFLIKNVMERVFYTYEDLMGQLATIPYSAVMGVLADDAVTVQSEDTVYQFLVRWTADMYRGQTRSEVWELDFMGRTGVIRFNYMSLDKLEKILNEDEMLFSRSFTERAVSEAKVYKKSIPNLRSLPPQKRMRQYKTVPLRMVETLHSRSIFVELSGNQVFNLLPLRTEQFPFFGGALVLQFGRAGDAGDEYFGLSVKKVIRPSSNMIYVCTAWVRNGDKKEWKLELEIESENKYENLLPWEGLLELDEPHLHHGYLYVNVEIKAFRSPLCDF